MARQAQPEKDKNNSATKSPFSSWLRADTGRVASIALIIFAVTASLAIFMDLAFSGSFITLNAQLVATGALLLAAGGLYAWLHVRYRLGKLNDQAESLAATAQALNLSVKTLNHTNKHLTQSEARYRSLVDAQGDIIMRRDTRGRLTFVNNAFLEYFDRAEQDVVNKPFRPEILRGRRRLPTVSQLKKPPHRVKYEQRIETSKGTSWIAWEDRAILGRKGKVLEVQTIGRDISAHKLSRQELAKTRDLALSASRAKSMFLATMSHEIRTPMNGVLGMAKLLGDTKLTQEQKTYTAAIAKSGAALLSLIDDILDFSKIEADKLELEKSTFDLAALVEDITELLAPRAHAKDLDIACFVDPQLTQKIIGDDARVRQVLLNLAGNALKFTEHGSIYIKAGIARTPNMSADKNSINIAFSIIDTGIGMTAQNAKKMFEDFTQADSTPSRKYGGTGLGLAISKRLAQQMGGTISVETKPGKGSTFKFILPFEMDKADSPANSKHQSLETQKILIITSGVVTGAAAGDYLRAHGAQVKICSNATQVHKLIQKAAKAKIPYTSLLCDHAIEPISARGQSVELEALFDKQTRIKKLVAIWPEERGNLAQLKKRGFDGYLVKPIRHKSLVERLMVIHEEAPKTINKAQIWAVPKEIPAPSFVAQVRPLRILLAEDNDINALLALSLLNRDGHKVIHAKNGLEAVNLATKPKAMAAKRHNFDLILMDIHMPELDGLKATRAIRKVECKAGFDKSQAVPIIALTANAFKEDKEKCLAAGMTDYLSKPIDPELFYQMIANYVMLEGGVIKSFA